jgi:putative tryptophan/tyrosine transport system substrate-binding protein
MRRIGLAIGLIVSLALAPLAGVAQQAGKVYRIGFLSNQTPSTITAALNAFRQKLRDLGYAEGRNLAIEYRWAEGGYARLPALARELVRLDVDVIVTPDGVPPALAAKTATRTIPMVFFAGDAVESGLVQSLARPGGNLTGVSGLTAGLDAKRLEILKEAVPRATRVAVLWNPENSTGVPQRNRMALAAEALQVQTRMLEARSPSEIDSAIAAAARDRSDVLLVLADPMLTSQRKRIVDVATRARLPVGGMFRIFAEVGALVSYGPDLVEIFRQLAVYADKILKGAKPTDLPVEEPTKYNLVVNLKTAKALGLTIPQSLLVRADEIIQ